MWKEGRKRRRSEWRKEGRNEVRKKGRKIGTEKTRTEKIKSWQQKAKLQIPCRDKQSIPLVQQQRWWCVPAVGSTALRPLGQVWVYWPSAWCSSLEQYESLTAYHSAPGPAHTHSFVSQALCKCVCVRVCVLSERWVISPCGRPRWPQPPPAARHRCLVSHSDRRLQTPRDLHQNPSWVCWGRSVPLCWVAGRSERPPEAAALCGDSWCSWSSAGRPSRTRLCYGTCEVDRRRSSTLILRNTYESEWRKVLPAGEFIRFVLSGLVEVQAELCVDPETEVVVHLHNLRYTWPSYSTASCQTVSMSYMQLFS